MNWLSLKLEDVRIMQRTKLEGAFDWRLHWLNLKRLKRARNNIEVTANESEVSPNIYSYNLLALSIQLTIYK